MEINLNEAIPTFHPNPSYEQVYFEAVANCLDAGADEIYIGISIESFDKSETLQLTIKDNGEGFTDKNYKKFSKLLVVDKKDHKGLGRLVYLAYFSSVTIESFFENTKKRAFVFDQDFKKEDGERVEECSQSPSGSVLNFQGYSKEKVYTYNFLIPEKIKDSLMHQFFPLFFNKKDRGEKLQIKIVLKVKNQSIENKFISSSTILDIDSLPQLEKKTFYDKSLDLFDGIDLYYSIQHNIEIKKSLYTAICVDNRAIEYELIPIEVIPNGYQTKFLFMSNYFTGKTNSSRQKLDLPNEVSEKYVKEVLRNEIGKIIDEKIPKVKEENKKMREKINQNYPHLDGYFSANSVGLIQKSVLIEEAQKKFFNDQRVILECEHLDDEKYDKAIELSSRTLAEYVMYRTRIISKLKEMSCNNSEKELHRLLVPTQKTLRKADFDNDIFNNNIWMLDDKFMSYNVILSDERMEKVIKEITTDEISDGSRPDIALVFSGDPLYAEKVNVVVIELKKHGLPLAKNEEVISQLRQRARKLLVYFPDKIEKIWFYGITDIDQEFRISLKENRFKELFSSGQIFYNSLDVIVDNENNPFSIDVFVMTYESLIQDAEIRNDTFLKILKSSIRKYVFNG